MKAIDDAKSKTAETAPHTDQERLEVHSKWFSVKLQEINGYTLVAMAMIMFTVIVIVALLAPA